MDLTKAAAALGREGGKAKVPKGFAKMSQTRLKKIAKAAIKKRWQEAKRNEATNSSGNRRNPKTKGVDPC